MQDSSSQTNKQTYMIHDTWWSCGVVCSVVRRTSKSQCAKVIQGVHCTALRYERLKVKMIWMTRGDKRLVCVCEWESNPSCKHNTTQHNMMLLLIDWCYDDARALLPRQRRPRRFGDRWWLLLVWFGLVRFGLVLRLLPTDWLTDWPTHTTTYEPNCWESTTMCARPYAPYTVLTVSVCARFVTARYMHRIRFPTCYRLCCCVTVSSR